jgi:hypothetical protein
MNQLSKKVYSNFTIQAELGEGQYSYAQSFFLSNTQFSEPLYPFTCLEKVLSSTFKKPVDKIRKAYSKEGVAVLRATVMNPYIHPMKKLSMQNLVEEFMNELAKAATKSINEI